MVNLRKQNDRHDMSSLELKRESESRKMKITIIQKQFNVRIDNLEGQITQLHEAYDEEKVRSYEWMEK